MTTKKLQLPVSGFTDGLNTEASVLNVLPSELMDGTTNIELFQNGSARRRRGVDFLGASSSGGFLQTIRTSTIANELKQESPAGKYVQLTAPNGNLVEKVVLDINNTFLIFDVTNESLTNIDNPTQTISRTVDGIVHSHDQQKFVNMQFSQSGKRLFFAGKHSHPGYLQVSSDNTNLEVVYLNVIIRDPNATAENAKVKNGGNWYDAILSHTGSSSNEPGVGEDWEEYWMLNDGAIPSTVTSWGSGTSYTSTMVIRYNKNISATATDTFPTTVEFFAGSSWLAGDPKFPNFVYFSQVVLNDSDLEKYHQFADPFNATDSAIVDDDGGVLAVQGAGLIKRLLTLGTSIFLGSNTGIWQISGPDGIFKATNFVTFNVLNDGIDGPESMVAVDDEFLVFAQNTIWRSTIQTSLSISTSGQASFKSVSQNRVESLYTTIPQESKAAGRAIFNPSERKVYYFYNKTSTDFTKSYGTLVQPGYTKDVLILDTRFQDDILPTEQQQKLKRTVRGAFFEYSFNDGANSSKPYIACPIVAPDVPSIDEPVTASGDTVATSTGDPVVAAGTEDPKDVVLILAMQRVEAGGNALIKSAFATLNTNNLKDWASDTTYAISYDSPIFSGIQTVGDSLHNKNLTYLYVVFNRSESGTLDSNGIDLTPGGCFLSTAWDYATDDDAPGHSTFYEDVIDAAGNFVVDSNSEQVYKRNPMREIYHPTRYTKSVAGSGLDGYSHVHYKHRVRGRGKVFQVLFLNDGDKDYHLVGWTQQYYGKPD